MKARQRVVGKRVAELDLVDGLGYGRRVRVPRISTCYQTIRRCGRQAAVAQHRNESLEADTMGSHGKIDNIHEVVLAPTLLVLTAMEAIVSYTGHEPREGKESGTR